MGSLFMAREHHGVYLCLENIMSPARTAEQHQYICRVRAVRLFVQCASNVGNLFMINDVYVKQFRINTESSHEYVVLC